MEVEKQVRDWDKMMRAAPAFEEFRDLEFVRRSGRVNMFTDSVQRELYNRGRFAGVMWLQRCKENDVSWLSLYETAKKTYELQHGPRESWFTSELIDSWEAFEIALEEQKLRQRLAELQERRSAKSRSEDVG